MDELRFGPFRLDLATRRLTRGGAEVGLGSRALDILCVLAAAKGQLVTKDDLMAKVWPGLVVEDNTIQVHVSALRKAIDTGRDSPAYVITVPGRGYRFAGIDGVGMPVSENTRDGAPATPDKLSIAVLAFQNLSGDVDQEYFADGISEDIITALSRFRHLFVIARNSSFTYKGRTAGVKEIADDLGVRYILEGSVRKSGNRIRISVQLVDAQTSHHVWAERYDRDLDDIFSVQDEITERVAGAIEPELLKIEGGRVAGRRPSSLNAWDLVWQGIWHFHQVTHAGHRQARDLFRKAVALDANLPDAHLWLARVSAGVVAYGWSEDPAEDLREGLQAAQLAIQLDPRNPYCHYSLAIVSAYLNQQDQAIRAAETAVEISPSFALGYYVLGLARLFSGDAANAAHAFARGLRLNPYDPQNFVWLYLQGHAYYFMDQAENALQAASRASAQRPAWLPGIELIALCYATLGRTDDARLCVETMRGLDLPKTDLIAPLKARNPHWAEHMASKLAEAGWSGHRG